MQRLQVTVMRGVAHQILRRIVVDENTAHLDSTIEEVILMGTPICATPPSPSATRLAVGSTLDPPRTPARLLGEDEGGDLDENPDHSPMFQAGNNIVNASPQAPVIEETAIATFRRSKPTSWLASVSLGCVPRHPAPGGTDPSIFEQQLRMQVVDPGAGRGAECQYLSLLFLIKLQDAMRDCPEDEVHSRMALFYQTLLLAWPEVDALKDAILTTLDALAPKIITADGTTLGALALAEFNGFRPPGKDATWPDLCRALRAHDGCGSNFTLLAASVMLGCPVITYSYNPITGSCGSHIITPPPEWGCHQTGRPPIALAHISETHFAALVPLDTDALEGAHVWLSKDVHGPPNDGCAAQPSVSRILTRDRPQAEEGGPMQLDTTLGVSSSLEIPADATPLQVATDVRRFVANRSGALAPPANAHGAHGSASAQSSAPPIPASSLPPTSVRSPLLLSNNESSAPLVASSSGLPDLPSPSRLQSSAFSPSPTVFSPHAPGPKAPFLGQESPCPSGALRAAAPDTPINQGDPCPSSSLRQHPTLCEDTQGGRWPTHTQLADTKPATMRPSQPMPPATQLVGVEDGTGREAHRSLATPPTNFPGCPSLQVVDDDGGERDEASDHPTPWVGHATCGLTSNHSSPHTQLSLHILRAPPESPLPPFSHPTSTNCQGVSATRTLSYADAPRSHLPPLNFPLPASDLLSSTPTPPAHPRPFWSCDFDPGCRMPTIFRPSPSIPAPLCSPAPTRPHPPSLASSAPTTLAPITPRSPASPQPPSATPFRAATSEDEPKDPKTRVQTAERRGLTPRSTAPIRAGSFVATRFSTRSPRDADSSNDSK